HDPVGVADRQVLDGGDDPRRQGERHRAGPSEHEIGSTHGVQPMATVPGPRVTLLPHTRLEQGAVMGRYDGRVAIITGAARGIGAGTAKRFIEEGAAVAIFDINEEQAAETAAGLGGTAIGVGVNVTDSASVEAGVQRVLSELGGLHVLINNAGITRDNLLFKLTEEDWDAVMGVHLKGAFLMSKAAQKTFVDQKYGKILNLSSISANGNRGQANYSAAKAGVQGFTRTLALELGPFGVNVNAIAPGFIAT